MRNQVLRHRIVLGIRMLREGLHRADDRAQVVVRQVAGIRSWIGQHLELLIQGLRDLQGAAGAEAEAVAGLALQAGQIVEQRRDLTRRLGDFGDDAGLADATGDDGFGLLLVPDTLGLLVFVVLVLLELLIEPATIVTSALDAKEPMHFKIGAWHEGGDGILTLGEDRKGRSLHTTHGCEPETTMLGIQGGQRTGAIDAHDPIALAAALRGIGQRAHLILGAQFLEGIQDGVVRHRLHPHALDRLLHTSRLHEVAENEFPFTSGVACIDDAINVLALHEAQQRLVAIRTALDGLQLKLLGNNRQSGETPADLLAIHFGHFQLQEVTHRRGDDVRFVLKIVLLLGKGRHARCFRQRTGKVSGDTGFFSDDQNFGHKGWRAEPMKDGVSRPLQN